MLLPLGTLFFFYFFCRERGSKPRTLFNEYYFFTFYEFFARPFWILKSEMF